MDLIDWKFAAAMWSVSCSGYISVPWETAYAIAIHAADGDVQIAAKLLRESVVRIDAPERDT
jgi:hypothetical protein